MSIGYRPATADQPEKCGGEIYPTRIRRLPIRPIRIFLQDGSGDLDDEWGNWFLANQQMVKAFEFANKTADARKDTGPRYDVMYEWGDGAHADDRLGALLPDVLRWMFREGR